MTEQQLINRAVNFAQNMKNINRFLCVDKATLEIYGVREYVVDVNELKKYYEFHETVKELRKFDVFLEEFQNRVENHLQ